ncbi:hypothetical protein GCM10022252_12110 [Streptosporangium oxazolinicum]|uniref:Uncharacterized protein n=1 Tax=Streptosporangium oxazolinicum TaxID=909287 RepID=A0ABP8AHB0_9ACTN
MACTADSDPDKPLGRPHVEISWPDRSPRRRGNPLMGIDESRAVVTGVRALLVSAFVAAIAGLATKKLLLGRLI